MLNEDEAKPFTAEDVRFTTKGGALYAIFLDWPRARERDPSLGGKASAGRGDRRARRNARRSGSCSSAASRDALHVDAAAAADRRIRAGAADQRDADSA